METQLKNEKFLQWDITSHPARWLLSKKYTENDMDEDVEKLELLHTVGRNVK